MIVDFTQPYSPPELALIQAIEQDDLSAVKKIVEQLDSADIYDTAIRPFIVALYLKRPHIVEYLAQVDPDIPLTLYPIVVCFDPSSPYLKIDLDEAEEILSMYWNESEYDQYLSQLPANISWNNDTLDSDVATKLMISPLPRTAGAFWPYIKDQINVNNLSGLLAMKGNRDGLINLYYNLPPDQQSQFQQRIRNVLSDPNRLSIFPDKTLKAFYHIADLPPISNTVNQLFMQALKDRRKSLVSYLLQQKVPVPDILSVDRQSPRPIQASQLIDQFHNSDLVYDGYQWPSQIINKYKLVQKLGQGGFGQVYLAQNRQNPESYVAIKRSIKPMKEADVHEGLQLELQIPESPYFIDTYQIVRGRDDHVYQVMEYVPWPSLKQVLKQQSLTPRQIVNIVYQVARALQTLHQAGIAHRDVKPDNIMYDPDTEQIKLLDFGLSCTIKQIVDQLCPTWSGTPHYMPAFILYGSHSQPLSDLKLAVQHDIWSLGVLIYYLLYSQYPFDYTKGPAHYRQLPVFPPLPAELSPLKQLMVDIFRTQGALNMDDIISNLETLLKMISKN